MFTIYGHSLIFICSIILLFVKLELSSAWKVENIVLGGSFCGPVKFYFTFLQGCEGNQASSEAPGLWKGTRKHVHLYLQQQVSSLSSWVHQVHICVLSFTSPTTIHQYINMDAYLRNSK